jgi:DNA-binding NarL/FixJ family response regulator
MNSPSRTSVLVVDDHPIFRLGLCEVIAGDSTLSLAGEAGDGDEALRLIETRRPTVAVVDIHMPKRTGLQVARDLWERRAAVGLIMLTMDGDEDLLNEALNLGVRGYLLKENATTELLAAIHAVADGRVFVCPALSASLLRRRHAGDALREHVTGLARLSPTERQILKLISGDRTTKEIAAALGCSVRTVETHRQNICYKLELTGPHSLLRFAFDHKSQL